MKRKFNKILAMLMVVLTLVMSAPLSGFTGLELPDFSLNAEAASHSSHPVCGSSCYCSSDHSNMSWTAWDGTTKMYGGYYYLTKNITLSSRIILDYSYTTYLCLNGYTITCDDIAFEIYSYRSFLITDCKGTGKIESSSGYCTISNNKYLSVFCATISNTGGGSAVETYKGTNTAINSGKLYSEYAEAIYAYPGSNIQINGGDLRGRYGAIGGHGDSTSTGTLTISGGTLGGLQYGYSVVDFYGNVKMTGGYIDGELANWNDNGSVLMSGGTINGQLFTDCATTNITGGSMQLYTYGNKVTVSAGTYHGTNVFYADNTSVSGGNFTDAKVYSYVNSWIYGGYFKEIEVQSGTLYLSGAPEIETLRVLKPGMVSAQNGDQSGSFGGETVSVDLSDEEYTWKDGDVVIKDVRNDNIAQKFVVAGEDPRWVKLERSGTDLVLRIIPHGTCGPDAKWGVIDNVLYIYGTGAVTYNYSGREYPWGKYVDNLTKVVVEEGITEIPAYTFEYCRKATTIILPETLKKLHMSAFNDCLKLNNILLPSSLEVINETSGYAFIRCESLTDAYYLGTQEELAAMTNGRLLTSYQSSMNIHTLVLHDTDAANCTQPGYPAYYQFDKTTVYGDKYDMNKKVIDSFEIIPALGHRVKLEAGAEIDPLKIENSGFDKSGDTYISTNHSASSSSVLTVTALYDYTLNFTYSVSSEPNYDKLYINYNGVQKDVISGLVSGQTMTLELKKGDKVTFTYLKDGSVDKNADEAGVTLEHKKYTGEAPAEMLEPDCATAVICDYCRTVIKPEKGHTYTTVIKKQPTHFEEGIKTLTCSLCGYSCDEAIEKLDGHTYEATGTVAPTCDEDGYTIYTCACGDTYTAETVPAIGHDYEGAVTTDPTCSAKGEKTYTCKNDASHTYTEEVAALGHTEAEAVKENEVASTCTEVGSYDMVVYCSVCGEELSRETETVPVISHSYESEVTAPTCEADGYTTYACVCGDTYTAETVPAIGHDYEGVVTTDPTCSAKGEKTYTCKNDASHTYTEEVAAFGHTEAEAVKENEVASTCTEVGSYDMVVYCSVCGEELSRETETVPVISHSYESEVTAPTCEADGYTTYTCACGDTYTAETVPAIGHDYEGAVTTAPTCTAKGEKTYTCKNDASHTYTEEVAALGHSYVSYLTPATLTDDGKAESICACGDIENSEAIAKIASVTLSKTNYVYDGKNKTPKVTIKDADGNQLVKNVDYKLSVTSKRSGIGRYTVKVTFIGNYEGTTKVYFYIKPGKTDSVKSASQTTSSVKLSWNEVPGAVGYTVYRYSPAKEAYVKAGTTEGTTLTVKSLYAGTKYTFRVVAYGEAAATGKVYDSDSYTLLKTATKTKTPELTKVTASATAGKAYVYHTDVSGETGYTVYYSTSKDSGFKKYANFKADTTRCDITGLTSGKTYYFKVRTYIKTDSGYVYSAWSAIDGIKVK